MAPRRKRAAAAKSTETTAKKAKPEEATSKPVEAQAKGTKDGAYVFIEHCKSWSVFKRKAAEVHSELCELAPEHNLQLVLNENGKPRKGAFEISVAKAMDGEKVQVWSGLPKGPPRKDKFPEAKSILDDVLKALK